MNKVIKDRITNVECNIKEIDNYLNELSKRIDSTEKCMINLVDMCNKSIKALESKIEVLEKGVELENRLKYVGE